MDKKPFDLNTCVKQIVMDIQETTKKHQIQIEGEIKKQVIGDREKIGQVMVNYLTNALKYSPDADTIVVRLQEKGNQAIVSVQDYGIGIAKKDLPKLFERFYRVNNTSKIYPGMGVGLFIVAQIITQNDGKVWVESQEGKGSTFFFSLKLAK